MKHYPLTHHRMEGLRQAREQVRLAQAELREAQDQVRQAQRKEQTTLANLKEAQLKEAQLKEAQLKEAQTKQVEQTQPQPHTETQTKRQKMIILRGKPGSGKTTVCETNYKSWTHVSADHFFYDMNGDYKFDGSKIQSAHDLCYSKAQRAIERGENVIVDNTNKRLGEFMRYVKLAREKGVQVLVIKSVMYFGSDKKIPKHILDSYDREYEEFLGEKLFKVVDGKVLFFEPRESEDNN